MPNDCYNFLTITSVTHDQWRDLSATFQVGDEDEQQGFLATYYPEPDWKNIPNQHGEFPSTPDKHGISLFPDRKQDTRWHEWRVQHWGPKWDVYDCFNDWENEVPSAEFSVGFFTAWAPPSEECLGVISKQFPGLLLLNAYQEDNMDFIGVTVALDGVVHDFCDSLSKYRESFVRERFPDLDARLEDKGLNLEGDLKKFAWDTCYSKEYRHDFSDYKHASVMESLVKKVVCEAQVSSSDCFVTA
jgi:hypothetical protein